MGNMQSTESKRGTHGISDESKKRANPLRAPATHRGKSQKRTKRLHAGGSSYDFGTSDTRGRNKSETTNRIKHK